MHLVYSTMPRATETARIISSCLPDVPTSSCDLLREGHPVPPIPQSPSHPDSVVVTSSLSHPPHLLMLCLLLSPSRCTSSMAHGLRLPLGNIFIEPHLLRRATPLRSLFATPMSYATSSAGENSSPLSFISLSPSNFPSLSRRALQVPPEAWLRMSLGNGSITRVTIRPSGHVSLKELGNTGHLPPKYLTFS